MDIDNRALQCKRWIWKHGTRSRNVSSVTDSHIALELLAIRGRRNRSRPGRDCYNETVGYFPRRIPAFGADDGGTVTERRKHTPFVTCWDWADNTVSPAA